MRRSFGQQGRAFIQALRLSQWVKNLAVFAPILFTGGLFNPRLFWPTFWAFLALCLLSSSSYLVNDIIDIPYDRQHPVKKNRPLARGDLSVSLATQGAISLLFLGLGILVFLGFGPFLLGLAFYLLHLTYSLFLKKMALWDILAIATSFVLRALVGEVVTGYHLSVWLSFTVIFLSLLIASGKRRSELLLEGKRTRLVLEKYDKDLLDLYSSVFAVATLISYGLFTYFAEVNTFGEKLVKRLGPSWSFLMGRKWLMLTLIPVIVGIMRYNYLVFTRHRGERPEKMLTSDFTLLFTVLAWGLMLIFIIYVM